MATKKLNLVSDPLSAFAQRDNAIDRDKIEFQFAVPDVRRTHSKISGVRFQQNIETNSRSVIVNTYVGDFMEKFLLFVHSWRKGVYKSAPHERSRWEKRVLEFTTKR